MVRGERGSLDALTGARFLAALWVVVYHYTTSFRWQTLQDQRAYRSSNLTPLDLVIWQGHLAVDFFFLLSGFILAYTYLTAEGKLRDGRRAFWVARLARIYPVYVLGLVIGLKPYLASGPSFHTLIATAGAHLLLVHAWFPALLAWNQPSWSLSVEALFYAIFPLLLPLFARLRRRGLWALFLGAWLLFALTILLLVILGKQGGLGALPWWRNFARYNPLISLPEFAAGMALGLLFVRRGREALPPRRLRRLPDRAFDLAVVGLIGALVAIIAITRNTSLQSGVTDNMAPIALPFFGGLLLLLAFQRGLVARLLSLPPVVWLGEISYGIYIVHTPLWGLLSIYVIPRLHVAPGNLFLLATYAVLVLGVSGLSFHYLERPTRRAIRGWWGRPRPAPVPGEATLAEVTARR
jgi:peptidoglycan/LPS O-acetylase OafA/YrhL